MNPADFISLAVKLSNSRHEADLRTAVGRAYYGAFHSVRELLEEFAIDFPPKELFGADIHRKVRFCLANAGSSDAALIATNLDALRRHRNHADYDLKSERYTQANSQNVKACVHLCMGIVDALQRCRTDEAFDQFRDRARTYARDVLRLPVHEE